MEEQDDQALWLLQALKKAGLNQTVLLRGPATAYAVKEQTVGDFAIGGVPLGNPPRLDHDLQQIIDSGVPVYAVREDAQERGITPEESLAGITWVERAGVAPLFEAAGRVFAW